MGERRRQRRRRYQQNVRGWGEEWAKWDPIDLRVGPDVNLTCKPPAVNLPADLSPIGPALEQWATQQVHSQWNDTLRRWESIPPEEQGT